MNALTGEHQDAGAQLAVQQVAEAPTAIAHSDQARAVAEIQASLVIAQSRPRNELRARDRVLLACQRARLAEGAVYEYPRGGQSVSGPSIRLAEVLARAWGNMTYGFRELSRRSGESEMEAFAWDLETNTKAVRQFAVRHIRDKRSGGVELKDERDIYELMANQAQRRVRACILEIIPGDLVDDAIEACEQTKRAAIGNKPMPEIVKDTLEAFEQFGVAREHLEERLGHRIDSTQPGEVLGLRRIWASLRDGYSSPADWFPALKAKLENEAAETNLNAALGKKSKPAIQPQAPSEPTPGTAQEPDNGSGQAASSATDIPTMAALIKALGTHDVTQGDIKRVLGRDDLSNATDDQRADLNARLERLRGGDNPADVFPVAG